VIREPLLSNHNISRCHYITPYFTKEIYTSDTCQLSTLQNLFSAATGASSHVRHVRTVHRELKCAKKVSSLMAFIISCSVV